MNHDETYRTLTALIEDELAIRPLVLAPETVLADLRGWDSVALAGVLVAIEMRFGVVVDRDQLETLNRVEDLAAIIAAGTGGKARTS